MEAYRELKELLDPVYPGLLDHVQNKIKKSEKDYEKGRKKDSDSFLWEHSVFVAMAALKICNMEKKAPLVPVVAALFHDIGKFEGGHYQKDDIPEEITSARLAEEILSSLGFNKSDIGSVVVGLKALYDEKTKNNFLADILHDADFLSKTGYIGVANFFLKSARRGRNLLSSITQNLSKELTYAAHLPNNMRTSSGKKLAEKRSRVVSLFFDQLLEELGELGIARFEKREEILPCPQKSGKKLKFILILPRSCPSCQNGMNPEYSFVQGIKCTELVVLLSCADCPANIRLSFCLPEISG
jgi:HD superfamily phosphodiesterase